MKTFNDRVVTKNKTEVEFKLNSPVATEAGLLVATKVHCTVGSYTFEQFVIVKLVRESGKLAVDSLPLVEKWSECDILNSLRKLSQSK